MSVMFSGSRSQPANSGGNLVEFKAGRCKMESGSGPTKRKVVAEKEKGLVYVKQTNDQLIHFCWKNRETGGLVDDLIIFPGDTEFKEVGGCADGQVFMLKFKSSDDRRLFWAQDGTLDKDIVQKVNDALNKPPSAQRMGARGSSNDRVSAPEPASFGSGEEGLGPLGGLDQRQLMQLLQFMNPNSSGNNEAALENILAGGHDNSPASVPNDPSAVSTPTTSAPDQHAAAFAQADSISNQLQQLLRSNSKAAGGRRVEIDLSDVTTGERVLPITKTYANDLIPLLAESPEPIQELIHTVHSPQLRQASTAFGHALQTGQMGPVLEQFGIGSEAKEAALRGDILEFAKRLTEDEDKERAKMDTAVEASSSEDTIKEPEPKRGKPDDEMDLD